MADSGDAYKTAYEEVERGELDKSVWAQCFVEAKGDENTAKALYIKKRVKALTADAGRMTDDEYQQVKRVENKTQAFLLVISMGAGTIFGPYLLLEGLGDVSELSRNGVSSVGIVTEYDPYRTRRGSIRHKHIIEYDGHSKPFVLDQQVEVGTRYPIMYSSKDPKLAVITRAKKSFWSLASDRIGLGGLGMALAMFVGFGWATLWNLKKLRS